MRRKLQSRFRCLGSDGWASAIVPLRLWTSLATRRAVPIKQPIMVSKPKACEAGYPNTSGFRKVVKATICVKKKEGMSDADFIEYYNTKHAQRAIPILQRHGIISYSLVTHPEYLHCPACFS